MSTSQPPANKKAIFSWILYDFANTIYSMNVVSIYFALWITVNLGKEDLWVSAGNSASMFFVALTLPILGTWSDFLKQRLHFLMIFTFICIVATAAIGLSGYYLDDLLLVIIAVTLFTIANYAYQGALVFYNAMLPQLSPPEKMGKISGYGVAAGYLGAILGLLMVLPFATGQISFLNIEFKSMEGASQNIAQLSTTSTRFIDLRVDKNPNYDYEIMLENQPDQNAPGLSITNSDTVVTDRDGARKRAIIVQWDKMPPGSEPTRLILKRRTKGLGRLGTFIPTAMLFLLLSLPVFLFNKEETSSIPREKREKFSIAQTFRTVWEGLSNTKKHPGVLRFLIAKFFYEEGIQTAIIFMGVYAVKVMGFSNSVIIPFFMVTTSAAVVGSFLFGYITDWAGPKKTLIIVISGWVICLVLLIITTEQIYFWFIGGFVGIFMGSTWTSARPLLLTLIPPDMAGEFFGLYSLSGKVASIFGPLLWGLIVYLLRDFSDAIRYKSAVGSLAILMLIGLILLTKIPSRELNKSFRES